ncbi:hypothetical protein SCHAM137S_05884 [Streptomyces chartreusis]
MVFSAASSVWTYWPSWTLQLPAPVCVHFEASPEKSSLSSVAPSAAVTFTSSYAALVAQVERPTAPAIGPLTSGVVVAFEGTTRSPTLFMNSFWTS